MGDVTGEEVTYHELGPLRVVAHWSPGKIGPVQLTVNLINPDRDDLGITRRKLRELHLERMKPLPERPEGDFYEICDWLKVNALRARGGHGRGRGYQEIWWARVALAYTIAMSEGVTDPTAFIGDMSDVSSSTAHSWVERSRSHGYLTRLTRGHNGGMSHGELTTKAREVLERVKGE